MRHVLLSLIVLCSILAVAGGGAAASLDEPTRAARDAALARSQAALGRTLPDLSFVDHRGRSVRLSDFHGKPLLVTFIYSSCQTACPIVVSTLADAHELAEDAVGDNAFNVIVVGFDAGTDTPQRLRAFARQAGIGYDNWRFLSGDLAAVATLVDTLGFTYYESPKGFDHIAQVSVIDKEGVVYRQIYGQQFTLMAVVEPLKDLVYNIRKPMDGLGGFLDRVKFFCTIYDPDADRYRFDISIYIRFVIGFMVIGGMTRFVVGNWIRILRQGKGGGGTPA